MTDQELREQLREIAGEEDRKFAQKTFGVRFMAGWAVQGQMPKPKSYSREDHLRAKARAISFLGWADHYEKIHPTPAQQATERASTLAHNAVYLTKVTNGSHR